MCVHAQVFVASYFSYMHIFAPHLRDRALRIIESATRAQSGKRGAPRFVVPHTHPGTCASSTRHMVRMCVDTDLACGDSKMVVPVPYVVSFPQWLVAERLPEYPRDTWLFFRGHLPKPYFDIYKVRTKIVETLKNEPNVSVVPANVKAGASYETHDTYLEKMLRAKFCINAGRPEPSTSAQTLHLSSDPHEHPALAHDARTRVRRPPAGFAPRGDTASAKRLYESIAAGCIPIIISDKLKLPFQRQMSWSSMSLRYTEREVSADPKRVLRDVQAMPPARVDEMRRNLMAVRHMFLWHTDTSRKSAVDSVIHELCSWEHAR